MRINLLEWSQYIDETFHGADVYDDIWQDEPGEGASEEEIERLMVNLSISSLGAGILSHNELKLFEIGINDRWSAMPDVLSSVSLSSAQNVRRV